MRLYDLFAYVLSGIVSVYIFWPRPAEHGPPPAPAPAAPQSRAEDDIRVFRLRLALDEEFRRGEGDAEDRARRHVREANRTFAEQVGVRWEPVDVVAWESPDDATSLHELWDNLRRFGDAEADVVLGFTAQTEPPGRETRYVRGTAGFFGRAAVIRFAPDARRYAATTLCHELGHILGAWHTRDKDTVMGPRQNSALRFRFDPTSVEAMRTVRDIDLRTGVLWLDDDQVSRLMRLWQTNHQRDAFVPIPHALFQHARTASSADRVWAHALCRRVIDLLEQAGRPEHEFVARSLLLIGSDHNRQGRPDLASVPLERAARVLERNPSADDVVRLHVYMQLGWLHEQRDQPAEAARYYERARAGAAKDAKPGTTDWIKNGLERVRRRP